MNFKRAAVCLLLGCVALFSREAAAQTGVDVEQIGRATVYILQVRSVGDTPIVTCVGSGTLVSREGLILTNAHNTVQNETCSGDTLIIALSIRPDESPIPRYQADIVAADSGLDIALLQIARQNDGRVIEAGSLVLPFVELGDSDALRLDDTLTVVGYPGIGDEPLEVSRGTVIGFAAEPSGGDRSARSWLRTSAPVRGTMSGGGAYDAFGRLVGIPTSAPVDPDSPESNCVRIQDSDGNGAINTADVCIPIGGAINSLRPANFAAPLLRAASLGLRIDTLTTAFVPTGASGEPAFQYLGFSPSVNAAGMPTTIIQSVPSGVDSLYMFFDYENMTPETVYELRVTTDGVPNPNFSLSPVRWSGGRRGLWYIGSTGQPLPNGQYDFTLFIDGVASINARLLVGQAPENAPAFSDIVFGLLDLQGNAIGNGFVLPTGATASAQFLYRGMTLGLPWTYIWYYEGEEVQRSETGLSWNETDGASGVKTISIQDSSGLLPGNYRLVLYLDNRVATVADFTLAGAQDGAQAVIFENSRFTTAATPTAAENAPAIAAFTAGTPELYALFDWRRIAPGTLWTMRWYVDEDLFFEQTIPWNAPENGDNFLIRLTALNGVPDGSYRVDLFINRLQFETTSARVGIGQLPIDRLAGATGVQMSGRILDSDTGSGIAGATVFIVSEDFSVAEFTRDWSQEQLFATAVTDRNGAFQIDRPLQRDALYSVVILAEGYVPITADGVEINNVTRPDNSPINIDLYLSRG